jgi:hypothetical protein
MIRIWTITAIIAALTLLGGACALAVEAEPTSSVANQASRFEDAVGDAGGDAPDIVAVIISEPDEGPVLAISVEFASEPPLRTDMETYTDVVFVDLVCDPEAPLTVEVEEHETDYVFGTHGVTLERDAESGAHLYVAEGASDLYWHVVDVSVDGPTIRWTIDRKLLGDPDVLSWAVLVGVEREDATEEEYDTCPDLGEPRGVYTLTKPWR